MKIYMNSNGTCCVFNEDGRQMPELQKAWIILYAEFLKRMNTNPDGINITMPNGEIAKIRKKPSGEYTWGF